MDRTAENPSPSSRAGKVWILFLALFGTTSVGSPAVAAQAVAAWTGLGGTSSWNNPNNWSPAVVPRNGTPAGTTYAVTIDDGVAGTGFSVNVDTAPTVDRLTVGSGDQLTINNSMTLTVAAAGAGTGTIVNAGTILLNSTGNSTTLRVSGGTVTLSGGGQVRMGNVGANRIIGAALTDRLTNVDNTISGAGNIGAGGMNFTNQGTVRADQANPLTVHPGGTRSVVNAGTLEAVGGHTLLLESGTYDNTGGLIEVDSSAGASVVRLIQASVSGGTVRHVGPNAGRLELTSNSTVTGGTVTNDAPGEIVSANGINTLGGAVTNAAGAEIRVDDTATLRLQASGTYTNHGTILLDSTGFTTTLQVSGGTVTLGGGGTLRMTNQPDNLITGQTSTDRLTNVDNTISGAGRIGDLGFTNQATVLADQSAA